MEVCQLVLIISLKNLNMLIWVCLKTAVDVLIQILMRTKARKKAECYSLLILTGEEWILYIYILRFGDRPAYFSTSFWSRTLDCNQVRS